MLRPVRPCFVAVLLVAATLSGCGGGPSDTEQVQAAVDAFGRATAAKDYKTLCDEVLAPKLVEDVTSVGLSCEAALKRGLGAVKDPQLTVGNVRIDGDTATAEIRSSASGQQPSKDTLKLMKVNGTWKISSLGS